MKPIWHEQVQVYDDIIPIHQQEHIKNLVMQQGWWKMYINTPKFPNPRIDNGYRSPGMAFYTVANSNTVSQFHDLFVPILRNACTLIGADYEKLTVTQGRAFAQFALVHKDEITLNAPHLDGPQDHLVVLYYITDATGDTIIFNNRYDPSQEGMDPKEQKELNNRTDWKTKKIVSPKQGRCVVFDGHYWHTSGQPTEQGDLRIIMNYNLQ